MGLATVLNMLSKKLNKLLNVGREKTPPVINSVKPLTNIYGKHTAQFLKLKRQRQLLKK